MVLVLVSETIDHRSRVSVAPSPLWLPHRDAWPGLRFLQNHRPQPSLDFPLLCTVAVLCWLASPPPQPSPVPIPVALRGDAPFFLACLPLCTSHGNTSTRTLEQHRHHWIAWPTRSTFDDTTPFPRPSDLPPEACLLTSSPCPEA